MRTGENADPQETSCWQLVAPEDYRLPADSQPAALQRRWKALTRLLRGRDARAQRARDEAKLSRLPHVRLAHLAPPIDWAPAAEAFARALAAQPTTDDRPTVRFLVGQPHAGHAAILAHWERMVGAQTLSPPTEAQILSADSRWIDEYCVGVGSPWVMPTLERCFLRHANGLDLVRGFLQAAMSGALGEGVIGCDSWAWAYLQRVWPLPGVQALTLQAFDGPALAQLLSRLPAGHRQVRFVSAKSGDALLGDTEDAGSAHDHGSSPELRRLAAHCRGNPGIAWHHWRRQLRAEPGPDSAEETDGGRADGGSAPAGEVVWVAAEFVAPTLPSETGEDELFVLHAVLLHDGLSAALMTELLPLSPARIQSLLLRLASSGLVEQASDLRWRVAPLAYPSVRDALRSRAFLVDGF
ncbi:MarR family transcriptional regulator [Thauera phenolivorans]|uniref:MarR family transcriptional regulator n=1 Tax=Thauera phenolivorans TaxID=1792543 RepID=UPI00083ABA8E|nr:MarR family transcriptional regulator [Thauera phenolivorans]